MGLTANINLTVPALNDNDVWFLNNAAWQAYWADINIVADFDTIANALYVESAYNNTLDYDQLVYNGVQYNIPTLLMFNSLLAAYQTLNTNYKALRDELKAAGFLTNSQ